jgi:hypothetical protein
MTGSQNRPGRLHRSAAVLTIVGASLTLFVTLIMWWGFAQLWYSSRDLKRSTEGATALDFEGLSEVIPGAQRAERSAWSTVSSAAVTVQRWYLFPGVGALIMVATSWLPPTRQPRERALCIATPGLSAAAISIGVLVSQRAANQLHVLGTSSLAPSAPVEIGNLTAIAASLQRAAALVFLLSFLSTLISLVIGYPSVANS